MLGTIFARTNVGGQLQGSGGGHVYCTTYVFQRCAGFGGGTSINMGGGAHLTVCAYSACRSLERLQPPLRPPVVSWRFTSDSARI